MAENFDLSKKVYSGEPLTPLENARMRELLDIADRSAWMRKQAWIWGAWAVGAPAFILGAITAVKSLYGVFMVFFQGGGRP